MLIALDRFVEDNRKYIEGWGHDSCPSYDIRKYGWTPRSVVKAWDNPKYEVAWVCRDEVAAWCLANLKGRYMDWSVCYWIFELEEDARLFNENWSTC